MKKIMIALILLFSGFVKSYAQAPDVTIIGDPGLCNSVYVTFYVNDLNNSCMQTVKYSVNVGAPSTTTFNLGNAAIWPVGSLPTTGVWGTDWTIADITVGNTCTPRGTYSPTGGMTCTTSGGEINATLMTTGYSGCNVFSGNYCFEYQFTGTCAACTNGDIVYVDLSVSATNIDINIY